MDGLYKSSLTLFQQKDGKGRGDPRKELVRNGFCLASKAHFKSVGDKTFLHLLPGMPPPRRLCILILTYRCLRDLFYEPRF